MFNNNNNNDHDDTVHVVDAYDDEYYVNGKPSQ